ncbi:MAG TPA: AarF/ABC1/UbiB kinase family protein [Pyrinomonadaceae bacterium]|nr:AarF/ABC1/UbiB kinase family protein [Pyrinomonadaceae bacterium]
MSIVNLRKEFHLARSRQLSRVLARHGLEYLAGSVGLERFTVTQKLFGRADNHAAFTQPEHLRMALEEMGTTFIKLGQILSTRADLLPPEYLAELTKLQDAAPPVEFAAIHETLVAELGQPLDTLFATFDSEPLAAASIGQAHAATLPDGTDVVVKVRRPGVVEQVEEDLQILQSLAAAATRHWEFANRYDLIGLAQEFAETLRSELDYIREGQSAERFAANFAEDPGIHVPRIFWKTTTTRVLTIERIRGIKINDLEALDKQGINRPDLAEYASGVILKMVCEDGFFHADPHPGNFFIEADGRIGLIDFGMVGQLDEPTQELLADLLVAISHQDTNRLVDVFLELGVTRQPVNRSVLQRDVEHLLSIYWNRPLRDLKIGSLLNDVFGVMRAHHLHLPSNLALLLKTLIMVEGLGASLDPEFHLTTVLEPYTEQLVLRRYLPSRWIPRLGRASLDLARLGVEMPQQIRRIIAAMENGNLQVGMRPDGLGPVVDRFERISNRIVLGVIAAAFINGLAVLLSVYRPPGWERFAGLAFAFGFGCALLLGIYLAVSILRSK